MYYCFLAEDITGLKNDPLIIQKNYAKRIDALCIGYLREQIVLSPSNVPVELCGKDVFLRCTVDNLLPGLKLLTSLGARSIETQGDIDKINNWYRLNITSRKIYELNYNVLSKHFPIELAKENKIFIKSKTKSFSAVINPNKIFNQEPLLMDFWDTQISNIHQELLVSKYFDIKTDSLGKRETRHVILDNVIVNSSRQIHSLKHIIPNSHKLKAQEIVACIRNKGTFPSNYILDLGEFIDNGLTYIDVVEINPISCAMCFVNNSIFTYAVPEIQNKLNQLNMGIEFCYDALSYPMKYESIKVSNKQYEYSFEKRYFFL